MSRKSLGEIVYDNPEQLHWRFVTNSQVTNQPQDAASVQSFLEKHSRVKYIRLQWDDLSGVMRTRIIPKERGLQIAQGKGRYVLARN